MFRKAERGSDLDLTLIPFAVFPLATTGNTHFKTAIFFPRQKTSPYHTKRERSLVAHPGFSRKITVASSSSLIWIMSSLPLSLSFLDNHDSSFFLAAAATALTAAVTLVAWQSDSVSRRWLLSPDALATKRHQEYVYRWNQALQKAIYRFQHVQEQIIINESERTTMDSSSSSSLLLLHTSFPHTEADLDALVESIVDTKKKQQQQQPMNDHSEWRIARLGTAAGDAVSKELYVWLIRSQQQSPQQHSHTNSKYSYVQVPLTRFGLKLAEAFERQSTVVTSTFCFVVDAASAGVASSFLVDLIQRAAADTSSPRLLVMDRPWWMATLAVLVNSRTVARHTLERIFWTLLRLEALRAPAHTTTIVVRLPGSATTPLLLPLIQAVFPDDRIVVAYTGCVASVQAAVTTRRAYPRASLANSLDDALRFTDPVADTTPLVAFNSSSSCHLMKPYAAALAALPLEQADTVETWMAAVDAYLRLKQEEEQWNDQAAVPRTTKNDFLPYVFKLDYVLDDNSSSTDPLERGTPRYWAVRSLWQYVTGSKSREVPSEIMDAALRFVQDYTSSSSSRATTPVVLVDRRAIEQAVFQHKLILLENKTLLDTVQPAQHWTLKAAVKKGCACCLPEDEEEQEAALARMAARLHQRAAAVVIDGATDGEETEEASTRTRPAGYVDGKTMFAFDPTRFS